MIPLSSVRYLLLQVRNPTDPIREQEVECFAWALACDRQQIRVCDLLEGGPAPTTLDTVDIVLVGGSGEYSTVAGGPWHTRTLDVFQRLYDQRKPMFASCWGFQALARALGGEVVHDPNQAELGSNEVFLTPAGKSDPVFGQLASPFRALMGHEDTVVSLPPDAIRLASTDLVPNQAYRIADRPMYATQFHPELRRETYLERVRIYPKYLRRITGLSFDEFARELRDVDETTKLLPGFVRTVLT
jgi:GMP synthase (glutamine-hydrolysing)